MGLQAKGQVKLWTWKEAITCAAVPRTLKVATRGALVSRPALGKA